MKKNFIHNLIISITFLILFSQFSISCDNTSDPPIDDQPQRWMLIPEFQNMDIRYILIMDNTMYVAARDMNLSDLTMGRGVIFKTNDGANWERFKSFKVTPGPMTNYGDTLYVLLNDSIYSYHTDTGWRGRFPTPERLMDPKGVGDIIFLNGYLYGMTGLFTNETFRIYPDGSNEEVFPRYGRSYSGTKFIKNIKFGQEHVYVRPHWFANLFYQFDGNEFIELTEGLTEKELTSYNPTNSMTIHNDTLFAGFKYPAIIKYLTNENVWTPFTDTLPISKSWNLYTPPLRTQTTALAFAGNRLFVATDPIGVVEWGKTTGWKNISHGLVLSPSINDESYEVFDPVVFLEYFNGYLFAGYGEPAYAPWIDFQGGGKGLYIYKVE